MFTKFALLNICINKEFCVLKMRKLKNKQYNKHRNLEQSIREFSKNLLLLSDNYFVAKSAIYTLNHYATCSVVSNISKLNFDSLKS